MEMNENKALEIIENMISLAKREIKDNGFYHLMWGYLVFFSAITDYFLLMRGIENHALVWGILMPLGGLASYVKGFKDKKQQRVVSYIDDIMKSLVIAFVISLLIVCLIMPMTAKHWRSFFPVLMVVYAFSLYLFGGILQFKPLQFGALFVWLSAGIAFFVGYDYQLLLLAFAVLAGFIIPGHLLNLRSNSHV
jgi:hypothetical protein